MIVCIFFAMIEPLQAASSKSTENLKKTVLSIYNEKFIKHDSITKVLFPPFNMLDIQLMCARKIYSYFASFLTDHYTKISTSTEGEIILEHISGSSAIIYFNYFLNLCNSKATMMAPEDPHVRIFFQCRFPGTEESRWLQGLRDTIRSKCFRRAVEAGETMDFSAPPIYLADIDDSHEFPRCSVRGLLS